MGGALPRAVRNPEFNVVTASALDALPDLAVMEELDTLPTIENLSTAIDCLSAGRLLGVVKSGNPVLLQDLHELLGLCW